MVAEIAIKGSLALWDNIYDCVFSHLDFSVTYDGNLVVKYVPLYNLLSVGRTNTITISYHGKYVKLTHNTYLKLSSLRPYTATVRIRTRMPTYGTYLRISLSDERRLEEVPGCSILLQAPITSCVLNTLRLFERAKSWRRHLLELFLL